MSVLCSYSLSISMLFSFYLLHSHASPFISFNFSSLSVIGIRPHAHLIHNITFLHLSLSSLFLLLFPFFSFFFSNFSNFVLQYFSSKLLTKIQYFKLISMIFTQSFFLHYHIFSPLITTFVIQCTKRKIFIRVRQI